MDKGSRARAQGAFESSNAATGGREEDETNRASASAKGGNSRHRPGTSPLTLPLLQERRGPMRWGYRKVSAFMSIGIKLLDARELHRIERHRSTRPPRGHLSHESFLQLIADLESDSTRVFTSAFESVKIRSRRCRKPPIPKPALFGPNLLGDRIGSGRQSQSTFSALSHCIFGSLY